MVKFFETTVAHQFVQVVGREVRAPLAILILAGNDGGAFPVTANHWSVSGDQSTGEPPRSGFWFSRKFRSHAQAKAFVESAEQQLAASQSLCEFLGLTRDGQITVDTVRVALPVDQIGG